MKCILKIEAGQTSMNIAPSPERNVRPREMENGPY